MFRIDLPVSEAGSIRVVDAVFLCNEVRKLVGDNSD